MQVALLAIMAIQSVMLVAMAVESPNGEEDAGKLYTFQGKLLFEDDTWFLQLSDKTKMKLGLPDAEYMETELGLKLAKFEFIEITGYYDEDRFVVRTIVRDGYTYEL